MFKVFKVIKKDRRWQGDIFTHTFFFFGLVANREYKGTLMLLRAVISKINWEKKSQDGRCCKSSAGLIYEFARLSFSKFISLEATIEMFLKHLMKKITNESAHRKVALETTDLGSHL